MGTYIGLDWAGKGWFGVVLYDDTTWETDLFPTIWSVWKRHSDATRILIDIPIGLPSNGPRACDIDAKKTLGGRGSSVFYTPVRDAVYQQNLAAAKQTNEAAGYSIQNQAWAIVPRVREVDEFIDMNPGVRDRLAETHPELCFYSLNGYEAVPPKTSDEGIERRRTLLADEDPRAMAIYEESRESYLQPDYAPLVSGEDDILDAMVAALTARRPEAELSRLPTDTEPPRDARGLPMQMVYPGDVSQTRLTTIAEAHGE